MSHESDGDGNETKVTITNARVGFVSFFVRGDTWLVAASINVDVAGQCRSLSEVR